MTRNRTLCLGASVLALTAAAIAAPAAAQLEEIVVTATKRASSVQDVPFSINAQSQQDILRSGSKDLEDLARNVAGLNIQNLGPGQSQVSIRGVSAGQIIRDQPGVKEQVGVYLDESVISLSLFTPDLDFYDLNRVETLRGPQGTLFGSGSIGGTIRYITNQPSFDGNEGSIEADLNKVDGGGVGGSLKGMYNITVSDKVALRIVGYTTKYPGYIDAYKEGEAEIDNDVNDGERYGTRIAATFRPSDMLSITPRVIYQKIETDGFNRQEAYNLFANPFTTTRPAIQLQDRQQYLLLDEGFEDETIIGDLTVQADFDGISLTSVTSYTDRDILVSRDASALTGSVGVDALGLPEAAILLPSNLQDTTKLESFTQEIRISSNDDGPLQWLVGGFYSDITRDYVQFLPTPGYDAFVDAALGAGTSAGAAAGIGPADSPFYSELPFDLEQISVFGEASYDITEELQVTVGGRWYDYKEERTLTQVGVFSGGVVGQLNETKSDGFSPRVMVSYDVNDEWTVNAQVSKGFRLGGVNDVLNTALCNAEDLVTFGGFQSFGDETLWNYEAGVKFNNGTVQFNAAAYYTDINNLQVTLDAGSCSSRVVFNVPSAHTMGIEAELRAKPTENFDISLVGSVLESEFDSTVTSGGAVLAGIEKGNRLASTPEYNIGATATYSRPIDEWVSDADAFFTASFQHRGSMFTQPGDQVAGAGTFVHGLEFAGAPADATTTLDLNLGSYSNLNLSTGIEKENWTFTIYANNVTDENANLSFDRERGGRARLAFRTNQPRTFGMTVRANF